MGRTERERGRERGRKGGLKRRNESGGGYVPHSVKKKKKDSSGSNLHMYDHSPERAQCEERTTTTKPKARNWKKKLMRKEV